MAATDTNNEKSIFTFIQKTNIIETFTPKLKPLKAPLKENRTSSNNLLELNLNEDIELTNTNIIPNIIPNSNPDIIIPINLYRLSLKWYVVYILYGLIGGIIINLITNTKVIRFDMYFNILISPIIYYNSPRKILTRIDTNIFIFYYTIPFMCGLCFRFMDLIPTLSTFTLNFSDIHSILQISLASIIAILTFIMIIYYIYISSEPLINSLLFVIFTLITTLTCYYYYNSGGMIHIHHYFVGLIIMLLSKNSKHKLVVMIHAIGYAIYIEGLSCWGFAPIFL